MATTLPADPATERLAKRVAEATGRPLPDVVRKAIEAEAARAGLHQRGTLSPDEMLARMTILTECFAELPVLDDRSADDILAYDSDGLPK